MNFKVLIPQLGARGLTGAQIIDGADAPQAEQGNNGDLYIRKGPEGDTQIYGPKNDGAWGAGRSIRGGQGLAGLRGWNPVLLPQPVNVEVSEDVFEPRILVRLAAWIGGQGTAPTAFVNQYVNAAGDGFTEDETEALDMRGEAGVDGVMSGMEELVEEAATLGAAIKGRNVIVASDDPVTLTLEEAEVLGPGWMVNLRNEGPGAATIEADGDDLIDGVAEIILAAGDYATIWTRGDGAGFRTAIQRNPADIPWHSIAVGGVYFQADDDAAIPPTDNPLFRFAKLAAGEDGAGQYNEGVLDDESIAGSGATLLATAKVVLAGSPYFDKPINLWNAEGRVLRGGTPGTVQNDQMQRITGDFTGPQIQLSETNGAFSGVSGGPNLRTANASSVTTRGLFNSANSPDARVSSTTAGETRMKNAQGSYFRRIL